MITTVLLDIGGTVFIKKPDGTGMINPAIVYLNDNLSKSMSVVLLSDTDEFDVPKLLGKTFPNLQYDDVYTKMIYPWINKTTPETYTKVCELIKKNPSECVLIDNLPEFRSPAEAAGIETYDVDMDSIKIFLESLK